MEKDNDDEDEQDEQRVKPKRSARPKRVVSTAEVPSSDDDAPLAPAKSKTKPTPTAKGKTKAPAASTSKATQPASKAQKKRAPEPDSDIEEGTPQVKWRWKGGRLVFDRHAYQAFDFDKMDGFSMLQSPEFHGVNAANVAVYLVR